MCYDPQKLGVPENFHFHKRSNENKTRGFEIKILYKPLMKVHILNS